MRICINVLRRCIQLEPSGKTAQGRSGEKGSDRLFSYWGNGKLLRYFLQAGIWHNHTCVWKRNHYICPGGNWLNNTQRGRETGPSERLCWDLSKSYVSRMSWWLGRKQWAHSRQTSKIKMSSILSVTQLSKEGWIEVNTPKTYLERLSWRSR